MAYTSDMTPVSFKARVDAALEEAESDDADSVRAATLRLVQCAVRDRDVSAREKGDCAGCPEAAVQKVLETMAAQREVSAREYDEAGRIEDAERERTELEIIEEFLPQPLVGDALEAAVRDVVEALEATRLKDMGRCMNELRARYPGQIETGLAGRAMREALS